MSADHILAIDQGTTSTRAILFDRDGTAHATARHELVQHYPASGWVEQDAEDIWRDTIATVHEAIDTSGISPARIAGIGITNQRETVIVWDRTTGQPIHRAIVWQDRRTAERCAALKANGVEAEVHHKTGLRLDPYFSATKIAWVLDAVAGARAKAERGELAFGTIDSFLLWRLTGGAVHATDVTNASRTMLYDIRKQQWDADLCRLFDVPAAMLPEVRDNDAGFGVTAAGLFARQYVIGGTAGDQQAALFGQCCFGEGMAKSTFGTGAFLLLNTGAKAVTSAAGLLTTPAYRINGDIRYALEGSIFVAGSAVQWLRDGIGVIPDAAQTERLAAALPDDHGVYLVPAFVGLGAPYWQPNARATLSGLTLDSGPAHLARAALEAVAYQTLDVFQAMGRDGGTPLTTLKVDGGMSANGWLCQFLADLLEVGVERPRNLESSALGAAFLAGLACGVWSGLSDLPRNAATVDRFEPLMRSDVRKRLVAGWNRVVEQAAAPQGH